jgi:small ligand-binding sensory domain FIST
MSAIAMRMPGTQLKTWTTTPDDPMRLKDPAMIAERIGLSDDFRAAIMIADPFTTPVPRLLPVLTGCGGEQPVPIVGGMASGGTQPGLNVLILNDRVIPAGGIGVSIFGKVQIDFVLSQGCRPIGSPMVVTKADRNIILELGSKPAHAGHCRNSASS